MCNTISKTETELEVEFLVNRCPWCKETPSFSLANQVSNETWCWYVFCGNYLCPVNPKSKYCAIRKTTKRNLERQRDKLYKVVCDWNHGNDYPPTHKKIVTFRMPNVRK